MGLFGKVRAYKAGWTEILGPLPHWMKPNGVIDLESASILSANIAPQTRVELIESHRDGTWRLSVESWGEGGVLRRDPIENVGRRNTPPILLRAAFVRACLRGLEDFEQHYDGSVGPDVFQRIQEIKDSGLL